LRREEQAPFLPGAPLFAKGAADGASKEQLMRRVLSTIIIGCVATIPASLVAQDQPATEPPREDHSAPAMMMDDGEAPPADAMDLMAMLDAMHDGAAMDMDAPGAEMISEIIVTGTRRRARVTAPVSGAVLSGEDLTRAARATLGETLASLPGISSTAFGPGVSRPVLRGLQGERTRLLVDGIQSLDVSNTSPDHAVAINPLVADRIEVLRGPSALLYGSGLVGGVVNTKVARVPDRLPDNAITGRASASFASAADEVVLGAALDGGGGQLAWHLDGHWLDTGDLEIGGFVLSDEQRTLALASIDPDIRALADLNGRLPNSAAATWDIAGGAALVTDTAHFGVAVSHSESRYGLPTRFSFDPAAPVPNTLIDLMQTRVDFRSEIGIDSDWIDLVRVRFGWADYAHDEVLDTGELSATFLNDAFEARAEVVGAERGIWRATTGLQYGFRDFSVRAAAPLLPPTDTNQFAVFSLHEINLAPLRIEAALRWETTAIEARRDPALGNPAADRDYSGLSGSLGASYTVAPGWVIAGSGFFSTRAPVVEELFTQGTDPGTQGVLLGNPDLGEETAWGLEGVLRAFGPKWSLEASAYFNRFPDYIFAAETGEVIAGLPVFQFRSDKAEYYGFEVQGKIDLFDLGSTTIAADALLDYTRATLGDGTAVPRIPPLRALGGVSARNGVFDARMEVEWARQVTRLSDFETPTDGYVSANLSLDWRPFGDRPGLALGLVAQNLFDDTIRRHASFLKDFAPVAGRDIRLRARIVF
jgi:iron complex outermembrane receptor protein